jgi:carbonic anhydrase
MNPEVERSIRGELGDANFNFHESFPVGGSRPETQDLAYYNITACRDGKTTFDPQKPSAVAISCSKIDLDRVQNVRQLGKVFLLSGRGGRVSDSGLASVKYGVNLDPSFMEILVHSCTEDGICRTREFQALDGVTQQLPIFPSGDRPEIAGIRPIDFEHKDGIVPKDDVEHAHSRFYRVAQNSPELVGLVASGKLLVGEAYFEENTGKVHWLRFWGSTNTGNEVPEGFLRAIVDGRLNREDYLRDLHPGLKALNALVLGNRVFTHDYELPVRTEVVVVGCADSRSSSIILKSPFGLVEWFKNAGNVVDDKMLLGLRVAVQSAKRNLDEDYGRNGPKFGDPREYKRCPTLLVLSHTQCGAIKETLSSLHESILVSRGHVEPLVRPIARRLTDYLIAHPNYQESDPFLALAAQENAIGACLDIITSRDPNARVIREMVLNNELVLVPGRHSIKRGITQMFKPLTGEHVRRLLPFLPDAA